MGEFKAKDMAHAICAGFHERPRELCKVAFIKDFETNRDDWDIPEYGDSIMYEVLWYAVIIFAFNCLILFYCKWKKTNQDKGVIQATVNSSVTEYMAMRTNEMTSNLNSTTY